MRCLFIDTSSFFINITIVDKNKIVYQKIVETQKDMASLIMPTIRSGMKELSLDIRAIDKIFVVNGPGSFTGVRVGVTVAKTIAWALSIPLIPLSSLEVIASTKTNKKYNAAIIDARRGNVFAGIYDSDLNVIKMDSFISFSALKQELTDEYELIGQDYLKPSPDVLKVINKHLNDQSVNPHTLKPNYLKLTEAEEKLNDKQSK